MAHTGTEPRTSLVFCFLWLVSKLTLKRGCFAWCFSQPLTTVRWLGVPDSGKVLKQAL